MEQARAFERLGREFGLDPGADGPAHRQGTFIGRQLSCVCSSCPLPVQTMVEKNQLSFGHGKVLVALESPEAIERLARRIAEQSALGPPDRGRRHSTSSSLALPRQRKCASSIPTSKKPKACCNALWACASPSTIAKARAKSCWNIPRSRTSTASSKSWAASSPPGLSSLERFVITRKDCHHSGRFVITSAARDPLLLF